MLNKIIGTLAVIFVLNNVVRAHDISNNHHARSVRTMKRADVNKDNLITYAEYRRASDKKPVSEIKYTKRFARFDLDQDGFITYSELDAQYNK